MIEFSHIAGAHSYLCFRFEELHSRGVSFQMGLADILCDTRFLVRFSPFTIYILFFCLGFCSVLFCSHGGVLTSHSSILSFCTKTPIVPHLKISGGLPARKYRCAIIIIVIIITFVGLSYRRRIHKTHTSTYKRI